MRHSMQSAAKTLQRATGLACLCLLLSLTGCATTEAPASRTTQKQYPPEVLLLEVPVAPWPASITNWGLLELARTYRQQLTDCQGDKAAIRAWSTQ